MFFFTVANAGMRASSISKSKPLDLSLDENEEDDEGLDTDGDDDDKYSPRKLLLSRHFVDDE